MQIRIKKMRDNAKLPVFKNGNLMDCYVSKIGYAAPKDEYLTLIESGEFSMDDINWMKGDRLGYAKGDIVVVKLGFAIELPKGKKMLLYPRSSTFRKYGLLLTNSVGVIDDTFNGDNDEVIAMFYATREGAVVENDRLVQMDIQDAMEDIEFEVVETLGNKDRGGFGSTGK